MTDPVLEALRRYDSCTLSNAIETFEVRPVTSDTFRTESNAFSQTSLFSLLTPQQRRFGRVETFPDLTTNFCRDTSCLCAPRASWSSTI
jgi:hypothetical protein